MDKTSSRFKVALPVLLASLALPLAARAVPLRTAVFPFELDDTSAQAGDAGVAAQDQARLHRLDTQLRAALVASGRYTPADIAALAPRIAAETLRTCDACVVALARDAGAAVAVNGWVQKVSALILNINLEVRDVATGKLLRGGSVDIRGDNDQSWQRGLDWLLRHRILGKPS